VLIYFLTGIAGYLASYVLFPDTIAVGASCALFGIMAAYTIFYSKHHRAVRPRISRIPALAAIWSMAVINFSLGFIIPHVDYAGHAGGFVLGVLLSLVISPFYKNGEDSHRLSRTWYLVIFIFICIAEMTIASLVLR
jgi:rhomboid protease GluP